MSGEKLWLHAEGDERAPVELPRAGVLSIGSSAEADLVLEGAHIAAVHCAIGRIKGGGWALKDLGTESGTKVNGKREKSARLADGDEIALGNRRLLVRSSPASQAPQAPNRAPNRAPAQATQAPSASQEPAPALRETSSKKLPLPQIKGFSVERPLGRGGMGAVFLAVQESLQRKVALKVMNPGLAKDEDFVQRFLAEARAAAALHNANVVTVFDVGEDRGQHYLAMEFMERGNLESRVARHGALPQAEVLSVLKDAACGLVFAEQKGIVHRDLKPANLMQNAAGQTKIADLGLATQLEADQQTTVGDKIFGTPHFIAPEQARGERVDARSDLYSLGATLYRLLSGRTPFSGETTKEILRGHFSEEPTPLAELVPDISPALAALVHRLLVKDPAGRYPSASLLLAEVERIQQGGAHQATATDPAALKRKILIGVGVLVLATAAIGGFLARGGDDEPTSAGGDPRAAIDDQADAQVDDQDPQANAAGQGATGVGEPYSGLVDPDPGGQLGDEDAALLAFEREAEQAFASLPADLDRDARARELRAFAERYSGTTQATTAREEAQQLESALVGDLRTERATSSRAKQELDALVGRVENQLGSLENLSTGTLLSALSAAPENPELAELSEYSAGQVELLEQAVVRGRTLAAGALEASSALEADGDFDASRETLSAALGSLGLRKLDLAALEQRLGTIEGLEELALEERGLETLRSQLEDRRALYLWQALNADSLAIGAAMRSETGPGDGSPDSIATRISEFQFETAGKALEALALELRSESQREFVELLTSDVRSAARALELLRTTHAAGSWRRKTTLDPRARGKKLEVRGVTPEGLVVDDSSGVLPWSAFGSAPYELHGLFHERLDRSYDAAERSDIATLLRISAVTNAVEGAMEMFEPSRDAHFTQTEAHDLLAGFDSAQTWTGAGTSERLLRERAAGAELAAALSYVEDGAWAAAVVATERLLTEHASTLLVRCFSDGSSLAGPPPEPTVPAPAEPPLDATPPDQPGQQPGTSPEPEGPERDGD